jgi:hypothetical protein
MFPFDALDATRICSSAALSDPAAWALPLSPVERVPTGSPADGFSWRSLARNPRALLVTGVVGGVLATDAALRRLPSARAFPRS